MHISLRFDKYDAQLLARLRNVGLKCTQQRLSVLAELEAANVPLTSHEMHKRLKPFRWDHATVFRNLKDLCDAKIAKRIDVGDHVWRFEIRPEDGQADEHPHFLCIACGSVTCLRDVSIADATGRVKMPKGIGFVSEVLLKGHCDQCARSSNAESGPARQKSKKKDK